MYYQNKLKQEIKFVKCIKSKLFDVIVDLKRDSKTFLEWSESLLNQSLNTSIDIVSTRNLNKDLLTGLKNNSILLWKILIFFDWERKWI